MSTPCMLITRPEPQASQLHERLKKEGISSILSPLMQVQPVPSAPLQTHYQAIIATSQQAVHCFSRQHTRRDIPLIVVGKASAQLARSLGWEHVASTGQNVMDIVHFIKANYQADGGAFLYIRGEIIHQPLADMLRAEAYMVEESITYTAIASTMLSASVQDACTHNQLTGVLFFSIRTLQLAQDLLRQHQLEPACQQMDALCLSQSIAEAADAELWRHVHACPSSNSDAMIKLLKRLYLG